MLHRAFNSSVKHSFTKNQLRCMQLSSVALHESPSSARLSSAPISTLSTISMMTSRIHRSCTNYKYYSTNTADESTNQKILDKSPISNLEHIYNLFLQNKQVMLNTINLRPEDPTKEQRVTSTWCPSAMITKSQANTYFGTDVEEIVYSEELEGKPARKKLKDFDTFKDHQLIFVVKKSSPHIKNLGINPIIASTPGYKLTIADKTLLEQRRQVTLLSSDVLVAKEFNELKTGSQPPRALITGEVSMIEDIATQNIVWRECFDAHPHVHWKIKQQDIAMFRLRNTTTSNYVNLSGESFYYNAKDLLKTTPDPLALTSREFMKRLNLDLKLLQKICSKGYNLDLAEKVVFSVDRMGIHVFGRDKFTGVWDEYYLEYGPNEIFTEDVQVQDFLFKMQTI